MLPDADGNEDGDTVAAADATPDGADDCVAAHDTLLDCVANKLADVDTEGDAVHASLGVMLGVDASVTDGLAVNVLARYSQPQSGSKTAPPALALGVALTSAVAVCAALTLAVVLDDGDALTGALAVALTLADGDAEAVGAAAVAVAFALLAAEAVAPLVTDGVGAAPPVTVVEGDAALDS